MRSYGFCLIGKMFAFFKICVLFCLFIFGSIVFWVLNLFKTTRVAWIIAERIGHTALEVDLFLRKQKDSSQRVEQIYLLTRGKIANHFLLKKWNEIDSVDIVLLSYKNIFSLILLALLHFRSRFVVPLSLGRDTGDRWDIWNTTNKVFYFSEAEILEGETILENMGITSKDWYVCIFARDSAYLDQELSHCGKVKMDWRYHDYRDSDIDTLKLAIQEILDRGGWVIRLGKIVAKEMSFKHPRVIDYPFSEWRSDFMDIYLQYRAKFVLSSSDSGITDVVALFGTPYCGVNLPCYWNPPYKGAISIPKKMYHKQQGRFISLRQWIEKANSYEDPSFMWNGNFYVNEGIEIINNTPVEILELTREMFDRLEKKYYERDEYYETKQQARYSKIYADYSVYNDSKNPIGKKFLQDNPWYLE